jgi:hypothetical protein
MRLKMNGLLAQMARAPALHAGGPRFESETVHKINYIKMNTWIDAHKYILNMGVGDYYGVGENKVEVVKRTKSQIKFSNGKIIHIKNDGKWFYFDGKSTSKKSPGVHLQILRDVEGYLVYKLLTGQ